MATLKILTVGFTELKNSNLKKGASAPFFYGMSLSSVKPLMNKQLIYTQRSNGLLILLT
jgi:hypothetical protein